MQHTYNSTPGQAGALRSQGVVEDHSHPLSCIRGSIRPLQISPRIFTISEIEALYPWPRSDPLMWSPTGAVHAIRQGRLNSNSLLVFPNGFLQPLGSYATESVTLHASVSESHGSDDSGDSGDSGDDDENEEESDEEWVSYFNSSRRV